MKNRLTIREIPNSQLDTKEGFNIETNIYRVEGAFHNIVKLLYTIEQSEKISRAVSVAFEKEQDRRTRKKYLVATIYLQKHNDRTIMKALKIIFLLALIAGLVACEDIFEKCLDDDTITVIGPNEGLTTDRNTITFWWEEVDGAKGYHLSIVSPSFDNIQLLVLDTVTAETVDKFTTSLVTGNYQWRIRAENNTSETPYVTRDLFIVASDSLEGQSIILNTPADNFFSNNPTQNTSLV